MENNNGGKFTGFYSKKLKAGRRRTYFFDVRSTKQGDYFLTITESKKKFEGEGYESHKIFLYKEDFKKFLESLNETVDYVKKELMPDFDYDAERPARTDSHPSRESNHEGDNHREERKVEKKIELPDSETTAPSSGPQIGDDEQMDWN